MQVVSKSLEKNLDKLNHALNLKVNKDICVRSFDITIKNSKVNAVAVFVDGIVDRVTLHEFVLQPLISTTHEYSKMSDIVDNCIPVGQVKYEDIFETIVSDISFGSVAIFIDGMDTSAVCDAKAWEHRQVGRADIEMTILGPKESFTEILRVNTALMRKTMRSPNLIIENLTVGKVSRTLCAVCYLANVTNQQIVEQVKRRLSNIHVDYIQSIGHLEQFIEDRPNLCLPQFQTTERPDIVTKAIIEGQLAILLDGSPFALICPITITDLYHAAEDDYTRPIEVNLIRAVRKLALFLSLFLPGLYIAATSFHHTVLPNELVFSIIESRSKIPLPLFLEVLILELAFELIREAGIRMPSPVGSTLGIVGGLILGQAAVSANLVSPFIIIIVAITGISSLATANYKLGLAGRTMRFLYLALSSVAGFLGFAAALFINGMLWFSSKSIGVPMFIPDAPASASIYPPVWKMEKRRSFLEAQQTEKQDHIARGWRRGDNE